MLQQFTDHIKKEFSFKKNETILLAISGGLDSVVMCDLFHQAGLQFAIAHCNFQLRGEESDEDENFVEALAEKYDVAFHSVSFDTAAYAKKKKMSIQEAARGLRYSWFEELRAQYNYSAIAVAHHRDDSVETFFINLLRGTGIRGLHGILPQQGNIIRPLLFTGRKELEAYSKKRKLKFREDSSNESDKYLRNRIRHHLIPMLEELRPGAAQQIDLTMEHLRSVEAIYLDAIEQKRRSVMEKENGLIKFSIKKIKKFVPVHVYLFEFLSPFGFNMETVREIESALDSISGKQFVTKTHRLIKDRDFLLLEEIKKEQKTGLLKVKAGQKKLIFADHEILMRTILKDKKFKLLLSKNIAQLDHAKLKFPLVCRTWQKGDVFLPIGMKGKKKLSDFLTDQKLSVIEKENSFVLLSGKDIVWVVGYRIDERYKVTDFTRKIFFAELSK
ncbi:MAG: tRNA lysidine(34) synthetase TilS [Bacteroidetes bacterium]|nr:tRNA lysidine(34) synthetase TilS [Bacteroidota bacterium]